jgi:hypothetical protein
MPRTPMKTSIPLLSLVLLTATPAAWSQDTPLRWWFDSTRFVVQPSDEIHVTATLTNTSSEPITILGVGRSFTGDLQKLYDFKVVLDLPPMTVVPAHSTLDFGFGDLIPIGGHVPVGTFDADPALLQFAIFAAPQPPENTFQIEVVPEPSVLLLSGVGSALLVGVRLLKRKSANQRAAGDGGTALRL